ncbi:DUF6292 family protein [Amycolatopsis sp. PS_44_ISF1]|uniref:DUF6292 family protein n=1 Tax=Amycolatopsis sp. PS_44_ISF1 TaxID=2974917 RepID=UPI0028DFAC9F|nr:DUF6292 family protein [Amycolatopsis sp. PS_44_ISF1]MDT8914452.1 DUF6292 family protein [Amycolatopsis sp. PS_44_ISF1]
MLLSKPESHAYLPDEGDDHQLLRHALEGYVRAVAAAVGVPREGTSFEATDTVTAYLGLSRRAPQYPGRDLMLVWSARQGWAVSVETHPAEVPLVLSRLGGDVVPAPEAVGRFVTEVVSRTGGVPLGVPPARVAVDDEDLVARMLLRTGPT